MINCPKCKAEIDHLTSMETITVYHDVELLNTKEGFILQYYNKEKGLDSSPISFQCPECFEELSRNEVYAIKILKGESE